MEFLQRDRKPAEVTLKQNRSMKKSRMKKTNLPSLITPMAVLGAAALFLAGCSKQEEPAAPSANRPKASESVSSVVPKAVTEAKETIEDAAQKASAEAGKLKTQAQDQVLQLKGQVVVEADKLKAQAQEQVQSVKDQTAAGADKLKTQAQALIDQASKLVADSKYAEAADVLRQLANYKLSPEQQKTTDGLGTQIKAGLAADATKSVGDLLKGTK